MYQDRFNGQGGSYLIDPVTGERTRVEEPTAPPVPPVETVSAEPALKPKPRAVDKASLP
jgi:hypothetical protein